MPTHPRVPLAHVVELVTPKGKRDVHYHWAMKSASVNMVLTYHQSIKQRTIWSKMCKKCENLVGMRDG